MKNVLITGAGSYVGTHVMRRLREEPEAFQVQELDVKGDAWRGFDFTGFDSVFHVAGIAHVSADPSMEPLYMRVNRDLAVEVAQYAKDAGVGQLVFMSSSIVYGDSAPAGEGRAIDLGTPPAPANFYGRSKLEAEEGLRALEDGDFAVAIVRAPMVYGPGCRGNFPLLAKMARRLPVFPDVENRRSMLYIENLAELVAHLVEERERGLFLPQDADHVCTSRLVAALAEAGGRRIWLTKAFNFALKGPMKSHPLALKAFGDLFYDSSVSELPFSYCPYTTEEAAAALVREEGWAK